METIATEYLSLPANAKARLSKGLIYQIQFSPDSTILAVASSIGIWIYDAQTYQELTLLTKHEGAVTGLAFSPDGQMLASGGEDKNYPPMECYHPTARKSAHGTHKSCRESCIQPRQSNACKRQFGPNNLSLGYRIRTTENTYGVFGKCCEHCVQFRWYDTRKRDTRKWGEAPTDQCDSSMGYDHRPASQNVYVGCKRELGY